MNVSVAAAILIFEAKDNEDFKLPILGYRIKEKKTQNYENKLFALITVIDISFGQITEPQVDALVNKTLHLMSLELQ
jgi:hypothetical protein